MRPRVYAWCLLLVFGLDYAAVDAADMARRRQPTPPAPRLAGVSRGALVEPATAGQLASAMGIPTADLVSAELGASDPTGVGIGTGSFGRGFPRAGQTFAILSTGAAESADLPNDSVGTSTQLDGLFNSEGQDMVQLRLVLAPPPGARCLAFEFAFYSEEFPEFVGFGFNDFFLAELGGSDFTISGSTVSAPLNFARDSAGNLISVNTLFGVTADTESTYDGATPLLRAAARLPATPTVDLVLTISDLGDSAYDSAVFLDRFVWVFNENCATETTVAGSEQLTARNTAAIGIPSGLGQAALYPSPVEVGEANESAVLLHDARDRRPSRSRLTVPGTPGRIRKLTVTVRNLTYAYAADVDILLVSPGGQAVMLMSDAGGSFPLENVTLTFDDDAEVSLPAVTPIRSGTYKPTNLGGLGGSPDFDFPSPAPGGPYGGTLADFKGQSPSGTWRLFVRDDLTGHAGTIDDGWELNILTGPLAPTPTDLDGDGTADPALFRQSNGLWTVQRSLEGVITAVAFGNPTPAVGDVPVPGDYDGDGVAEVAVYRPVTGQWFARRSTDSQLFTFSFGLPQPGDTPIPGDYDGDGITDPALYRAASGLFLIRRSSDGTTAELCCANPGQGDVPIPADYDGDGKADLAVYRPATGALFILRSLDGQLVVLCCADAVGDAFIPADYDGDGKADLAKYRPSTGEFQILQSSAGFISLCCASPAFDDRPVVADYDGDGKADVAVYGVATGTFRIFRSSDRTLTSLTLGTPGLDTPAIRPAAIVPVPPPPPVPPDPPAPVKDPPDEPPSQPPACKPDPEGFFPAC